MALAIAEGLPVKLWGTRVSTPMSDEEVALLHDVFGGRAGPVPRPIPGKDLVGLRFQVAVPGRVENPRLAVTADAASKPLRLWMRAPGSRDILLNFATPRSDAEWITQAAAGYGPSSLACVRRFIECLHTDGPTAVELELDNESEQVAVSGGVRPLVSANCVQALLSGRVASLDVDSRSVRDALSAAEVTSATLSKLQRPQLIGLLRSLMTGFGSGTGLQLDIDTFMRLPPNAKGNFLRRWSTGRDDDDVMQKFLAEVQRKTDPVGNGRVWPAVSTDDRGRELYVPSSPQVHKLYADYLRGNISAAKALEANAFIRQREGRLSIEDSPLIPDFTDFTPRSPALSSLRLPDYIEQNLWSKNGFLDWCTAKQPKMAADVFAAHPTLEPLKLPAVTSLTMPTAAPTNEHLNASVERAIGLLAKWDRGPDDVNQKFGAYNRFLKEVESVPLRDLMNLSPDAVKFNALPEAMRTSANDLLTDDATRCAGGDRSQVVQTLRELHKPVQGIVLRQDNGAASSGHLSAALNFLHDIAPRKASLAYASPIQVHQELLDSVVAAKLAIEPTRSARLLVVELDAFHRPGQPLIIVTALQAAHTPTGVDVERAKEALNAALNTEKIPIRQASDRGLAIAHLASNFDLNSVVGRRGPEYSANFKLLKDVADRMQHLAVPAAAIEEAKNVVGSWMSHCEQKRFVDRGVQNPFCNPVSDKIIAQQSIEDFHTLVRNDLASLHTDADPDSTLGDSTRQALTLLFDTVREANAPAIEDPLPKAEAAEDDELASQMDMEFGDRLSADRS